MRKLCYVATIPDVVHAFLKDHIRESAKKWQVTVVSHVENSGLLSELDMRFIPLDIRRKASLLQDIVALIRLMILFRRERFDLVHSIMPKSGLLSMLAAKLAGVPVRMHTFTGQVWASRRGWRRIVLKMFDKMIVLFATHILVDSPSQREFLVAEGVLSPNKGIVIGQGSICGVDSKRFHPDAKAREMVRAELDIKAEQHVILFMGRLNLDKGVLELVQAYVTIASQRADVVLLLVGAEENVSAEQILSICDECRNLVRRVGFTPTPERYMAAADILSLPSYREGFGQVIIEAAATGLPTVATQIYGVTDAVEDGKTGLLIHAGDVAALIQALLLLIDDQETRQQMGEAAQIRAREFFASEKVTASLMALYEEAVA